MAAPALIAGTTILNRSLDLSHGWSKQATDMGSVVSGARLLVGVALVFMVRKAARQ